MSTPGEKDPNTLVDSAAGLDWLPSRELFQMQASAAYLVGQRIAAGGMGTVHLGLKQGALGFQRVLAIKRLHGHLAQEPEFVARFKDEIGLVSRLTHPNVVQTFDVLESAGEVALVMEFVDGVTLQELIKDVRSVDTGLPIPVAVGVLIQALHGLHAAHELTDNEGRSLHLVHRDVSPQNIMIGKDGLVKVLDFGIAKAAGELHITRTGQLSGKVPYMSPEQVCGRVVDRRTDVFAAGVVLWESLTGERLFRMPGTPEGAAMKNVLELRVRPPSELREGVSAALDRIVLRALDRDMTRRYGSARDFALALEAEVPQASPSTIASGLAELSSARLNERALTLVSFRARLGAALSRPTEPPTLGRAPLALEYTGEISPEPEPETIAVRAQIGEPSSSELQGIAVDSPDRRGARRRLTLALGVAAALLAGGVAVTRLPQWSQPQASVAASVPPQPEAAVAVAVQPTPRSSSVLTSQVSVVDEPSGQGKQPAVDALLDVVVTRPARKQTPTASTKPGRRSTRDATGAASPGPGPVPQCSPPTFTDADGIRHFKMECL